MTNRPQLPGKDTFSEIRVDKLTFAYPGASHPALQDVSLRIGRGEKVAIVGPNGSGKTTLVKLLCRLYDPDQGCITVNGTDITAFDPAAYRGLFSVVFQNFMLYYLSAGDNIRLGYREPDADRMETDSAEASGESRRHQVPREYGEARNNEVSREYGDKRGSASSGESRNNEVPREYGDKRGSASYGEARNNEISGATAGTGKVREAAEAAGVRELLESLPEGYDTQLGHHTEGGRELSWGEWQKIAIARAVYRNSPVLILDEPASSLDADSEYEIFSDLNRITGGRTCIFISHRLSNVRDADRIIVLDRGSIAETGTHDELMAAGGRYHKMFTRQKSMYR